MGATQQQVLYIGSMVNMYDEILGPVYFEPYAGETATRVAAMKPSKVLEVACGTGRVTVNMHKVLHNNTEITATDISADMMASAQKKLDGAATISWKVADAMDLPYADESFDVVVCQFGMMFFADKPKAFAEAWRVLIKGGRIIFITWDKLTLNPVAAAGRQIISDFFDGAPPASLKTAFTMTDKNELQKLAEEGGFSEIKIETMNKPCVAESAEALAMAQVDGSLIANVIREKDAEAIPVIREKIAEAIAKNFGNHPVRSTMQAIFVTAQKP
jgi:ubiquinone/menaquinone biosynthesis C-methylase UbiE